MTAPDPLLASALQVALEADAGSSWRRQPELAALAFAEVRERLAAGADVAGVVSQDLGALLPTQVRYRNSTLLALAISYRRLDVAELLIAHGACPTDPKTGCTSAYREAGGEREMIRFLLRHGADPALFDREDLPIATGAELIPEQTVPADFPTALFTAQRGLANPQRCTNPFFLDQIRSFDSARRGARRHSPANADASSGSPVFSFDRFGRTITRLPDGRLVLIAGEHEDSYDADFWIYNDVCILGREGSVDYFLYPMEDFPPTDSHTATLLDDHILIIGCLGYPAQRKEGVTPVHRLDLDSWRISRVETTGGNPGWIHHHRAELRDGEIRVEGGFIQPDRRPNVGIYALTPSTMHWRRIA